MITKNTQSPRQYSLLHSPNPYKVYQLANSSLTTNVSGSSVTFIINIGVGDPVNWRVYVWGKKDRGLGVGGTDPAYPYFVEQFTGSNSATVTRTESPDSYAAVLALLGVGEVDFSYFEVETAPCQPNRGQKYCNNNVTRCQWNQSICNYDCFGCPSGQQCSNGDCISTQPPTTQPPCVPPSGQKYCNNNVTRCQWNQSTCNYDCYGCSSGQHCSNGDCITVNPCAGVPNGAYTFGCCKNQVLVQCYSCSGYPNYQCSPNPSGIFIDQQSCQSSCVSTTQPPTTQPPTQPPTTRPPTQPPTTQPPTTQPPTTGPPTTQPPGGSECPNCDLTTNYCLLGNCIPKNYALYGGIGFLVLMMFKR